jgi:hypothetical protein
MALTRTRVTEGRFAFEGNSDGRGHDGRTGRRDRPCAVGCRLAGSVRSGAQRGDRRPRSTRGRQRPSDTRRVLGKSIAGDGICRGAHGGAGAGDPGRFVDSSQAPWIVALTDAEPGSDGDATTSAGGDTCPVGGADADSDSGRHAAADARSEADEATERSEGPEIAAAGALMRDGRGGAGG